MIKQAGASQQSNTRCLCSSRHNYKENTDKLGKIHFNGHSQSCQLSSNLIRIVPIFEFQNLRKLGHSDFQEEKKALSFVKIGTGLLKIGLESSKSYCFVQYM